MEDCREAASAFPQEIYDVILDFLHDDEKALKACSKVCRGWVPSTRYHLFHTLQLREYGKESARLMKLLRATRTTFQPFVRQLFYDGRKSERDLFLPRILATLRRQRTDVWSAVKMDAGTRVCPFQDFASLRALCIENTSLGSTSELVFAICKFTRLESLRLWWIESGELELRNATPIYSSSLPCLRSLDVDANLLHLFLPRVCNVTKCPIISLSVKSPGRPESVDIRKCLLSLGPSLLYFSVVFSQYIGEIEIVYRNMDLSSNTNLRSLHIVDRTLLYYDEIEGLEDRITPFLARIASPALEEIALEMWVELTRDAVHLPLKEIGALLSGPRFVGLKTLHIDLVVHDDAGWTAAEGRRVITEAMPGLEEKGKLRIGRLDTESGRGGSSSWRFDHRSPSHTIA